MSPFRYRDEEPTSTVALYVALGALAGFAAGVVVAQQGGLGALGDRIRERLGREAPDDEKLAEDEDYEDEYQHAGPLNEVEELEERVLEAFRNDPILSERAVDIGAIGDGIVELTGWVNAEDEAEQAIAVTRGVPGVDTVVNRLGIRAEEDFYDDLAERYEDGDPALTEGQWEGRGVGTGRRRQGNSSEPDRHEDPRPELEETALRRSDKAAAEDIPLADTQRERSRKGARRGRADGSPVAPTGVPKGDHVADPLDAAQRPPGQ